MSERMNIRGFEGKEVSLVRFAILLNLILEIAAAVGRLSEHNRVLHYQFFKNEAYACKMRPKFGPSPHVGGSGGELI
jgi:hypothetical protein